MLMILLYVFLWLVVCFGLSSSWHFQWRIKEDSRILTRNMTRRSKCFKARAPKYDANLAHLKSIGFQIDQTKKMANRTFYFDYQKRLTLMKRTVLTNGICTCGRPNKSCLIQGLKSATIIPALIIPANPSARTSKFSRTTRSIECALLQDARWSKRGEAARRLRASASLFRLASGDG